MTKADEDMTEEQTFNEWVKQLEPSMAVPMYPKALLLDFMKKAFFAGLEQHSHDYLVKTKDLKANYEQLEKENAELKKKLKEKLKTIADKDLSFVAKFDALENENAELKQNKKTVVHLAECLEEKQEKQLTQAKEIIKDLMSFSVQLCDCRHTVDFEKTREKAVQFLKADVGTKNYEEQDKILKTRLL